MQALSGATRAECFFMVSRQPAGAPRLIITYILGPAGARLSVRWPAPRRSSRGPRLRACLPGCPRCSRPRAGSLQRPPLGTHLPWPRSYSARERTASRSEVAANSNVMYKCAPHSNPTSSPAPPPHSTLHPLPWDAQPRSLLNSLVLAAGSNFGSK